MITPPTQKNRYLSQAYTRAQASQLPRYLWMPGVTAITTLQRSWRQLGGTSHAGGGGTGDSEI